MEPRRSSSAGFPYDPEFDYQGFKVRPELDGMLVGTNEASKMLGLQSLQAVRNLVAAGRLPALLGDQPVHKQQHVPLWAVHGLAKYRAASASAPPAGGGLPQSPPPPARERRRPAGSPEGDAEAEQMRQELSRLRAENSDLRFAWAAMRESRKLLDAADEDRQAALGHLREAERQQSAAAEKASRAARLQSDALTVYVMPADGEQAGPPG